MDDKDLIWEIIHGQCLAKANHYAIGSGGGKRWIMKDEKIRLYEKQFMQQCTIYRNRQICTPFVLFVKVFNKNMKYDLDNSLKTILDVLQYCNCITDDNLCMSIQAEKHLSDRPRIEYAIKPFNEQKKLF